MQAVVFDFDGVLADTMGQHAQAYREVLAPYDIVVTDEAVFAREGARSETIIRDLMDAAGVEHTDADIVRLADAKQGAFRALGRPPLYPGAQGAVAAARQRTEHVAVVTGTRRENLEALAASLMPQFSATLSQEDYSHDKPHPEPYERAARQLGLPARECIAVENAVRGVQSAKAAGYGAVIAIATTMHPDALVQAGADRVVDDHAALADLLLEMLA